LDVLDQRMFRIETARWTRKRLALDAVEHPDESLVVLDRFPSRRFLGDRFTNVRKRVRWRHPHAAAEEDFVWSKMHVEAWRVHVLAGGVAKVARGVLLVRTLVLRKADVPVDTKHRAAVRTRIGDEAFGDPRKPRRHGGDEGAHRGLHAVPE